MRRTLVLIAAAALAAGCAPDVVNRDNGRWLVTHRAGEIDYEMGGLVLFPYDSDAVGPHADDVIADVAADARRHPRARIEVEGFTDTSGGHDNNMILSQARAEHVADILVHHGIRPERINARGYGETRLAVRTGDGVREPRNRRVIIRLIG